MIKFGKLETGDILNGEFFTTVQRRALKFKMPIELRSPEQGEKVERFLSQVANAGQQASEMVSQKTPASILRPESVN